MSNTLTDRRSPSPTSRRSDATMRPPLPRETSSHSSQTGSVRNSRAQSQEDDQRHQYARSSGDTRSRATSRVDPRARPIVHQPTPVKDAVNDAFVQAPTASELDPVLLKNLTAQITEQVIKNLQAANIHGSAPVNLPLSPDASHHSGDFPDYSDFPSSQRVPESPRQALRRAQDVDRSLSPPKYRSPDRLSDEDDNRSAAQGSRSGRQRSSTHESGHSTPTSHARADMGLRRTRTASSYHDSQATVHSADRRDSALDGADIPVAGRDDRNADASNIAASRQQRERLSPPSSVAGGAASDEPTTLEKIWQPFFEQGKPTPRLSQFLRGLAQHMIDDFEPKDSLVIGPAKMLRFFEETQLSAENYPWCVVFGRKMSSASLGGFYRKLPCHYHLVQDKPHEAPSVPALTPQGFEALMTCLIQAHPEQEFERLRRAVVHMPICNADDKSERFPKDLSRRLLPQEASMQAEQRLISALSHEPVLVQLPRRDVAMPPPPSSAPPARQASVPGRKGSHPYDDDDNMEAFIPSVPIERERKPYYCAKEGGGKKYDVEGREREQREQEYGGDARQSVRHKSDAPDYGSASSAPRPIRTQSNANVQGIYSSSAGAAGSVNPPPNARHRMSFTQGVPPPPPMNGPGRRRSPPAAGNSYSRSEPSEFNNSARAQYEDGGARAAAREKFPSDFDEDAMRRRRRRSERNNYDERFDGGPRGEYFSRADR